MPIHQLFNTAAWVVTDGQMALHQHNLSATAVLNATQQLILDEPNS